MLLLLLLREQLGAELRCSIAASERRKRTALQVSEPTPWITSVIVTWTDERELAGRPGTENGWRVGGGDRWPGLAGNCALGQHEQAADACMHWHSGWVQGWRSTTAWHRAGTATRAALGTPQGVRRCRPERCASIQPALWRGCTMQAEAGSGSISAAAGSHRNARARLGPGSHPPAARRPPCWHSSC